MTNLRDYIGRKGEPICNLLLLKPCRDNLPLFRAEFLGDKFEGIDFLVTLEGTGDITPFFFVQVKATLEGYTEPENRLRVQVSREDMRKLRSYPAPTYIVGIDASTIDPSMGYVPLVGYILSASATIAGNTSSLTTQFPLDCKSLQMLWDEVNTFWKDHSGRPTSSRFSE